jgi:hypothetical protein
MTVRVVVVHRVEEYSTWKEHFDAAFPTDLRSTSPRLELVSSTQEITRPIDDDAET